MRIGHGCAVCGATMLFIRGRFPKEPEREVCPTCLAEKMEQIKEISNEDYGRAFTDQGNL